MFHYREKFKPFEADGATLENTVEWLQKTTGVSEQVVGQVVAETMDLVDDGVKFKLPCPCGCGMSNVHTPINHFMLSRAHELKTASDKLVTDYIEDRQKKLLESQMRKISNFDKEYYKVVNGTWFDRNTPTLKRWFSGA